MVRLGEAYRHHRVVREQARPVFLGSWSSAYALRRRVARSAAGAAYGLLALNDRGSSRPSRPNSRREASPEKARRMAA